MSGLTRARTNGLLSSPVYSLVRFCFMTVIEATAAEALWKLLRPAAVSVAAAAAGASGSAVEPIDENVQNDPTIKWPSPEVCAGFVAPKLARSPT